MTLALLTAGEKVDSPTIQQALGFLRGFGPQQLNSTYAIGLQTMVFAAAEPERDRARIVANVEWLERAAAQERPARAVAGKLDLHRLSGIARRQLQHPVRTVGPECRQRGRRARPAGSLGTFARVFRGLSESRRRLGLYAQAQAIDRQHDLRRHREPDHLRFATLSEPRAPGRRNDPSLRRRADSTST